MSNKSIPCKEELSEWLQDAGNAAEYINAAIEDGDRAVMLLALRDVVTARGDMATVAEKAHLGRENLYKMLSKRGNPEFKTIASVLHAMGLRMTVKPATEQKRVAT
ncbi:putative addiction module antidote protein [Oryzomonas sagensis]|uniref:Addiction module antidote protein n=1 Tax=Oryzomonas sagensis TaxID=2603857 RepID=A0ABQ6TNG3_9BACT|nr:addiction module antidote protein [Oryzomonas sagensis]KAB0670083.1 putative addiction module antidote protein [Oryzomonas sagensis]